MSVSSHLTPEPERRLWLILESQRQAVVWADAKIGVLCLLAAVELALAGPRGALAAATLGVALLLGLFALSPLADAPPRVPGLAPVVGKSGAADCLIDFEDIAKHGHGELIHRLDKYLGGGITATQYYEDLVGQILSAARNAKRKTRLLGALCLLVGLGQAALIRAIIR